MFNHDNPLPYLHCLVYIFAFCFLFLIYANLHKSTLSNLIHKVSHSDKEKENMVVEAHSTHAIGSLCFPSSLTKSSQTHIHFSVSQDHPKEASLTTKYLQSIV